MISYKYSMQIEEVGDFLYKYNALAYSAMFNPTLRTKLLLLMVQLDMYNVYYPSGYFSYC